MKIINVIIFAGFISLWVYSLVIIAPKSSFSVLSKYEKNENLTKNPEEKLLKGQKIFGKFVSQDDYLGIVAIRFIVPNYAIYDDQDIIKFRIKEEGAKNWYAENTYSSGILKGAELFPFGFSPISDSKGKKFILEIESQNGTDTSAIALSNAKPVLITQYQFSLSELLRNPVLLLDFFVKKITNSLLNRDMLIASIPYLLPLILFTIWIIFSDKFRKIPGRHSYSFKSYVLAHLVALSMLLLSIAGISEIHFSIYLILVAFWIATIKFYKFDYSLSLLFSAGLFIVSVFSVLIDNEGLMQKSSIAVYIFLSIGAVQAAFEKSNKNKINYRRFLADTFGLE